MSLVTRTRRSIRVAVTAVIIATLLAVAAPAHAIVLNVNNQNAVSSGGDGGNGGIGINAVLLNCFLLFVTCSATGPIGGGNAPGGNGEPSFAFNVAPAPMAP